MTPIKTSKKNDSWLSRGERPVVIAGPCSAETEVQTLETARRLHSTGKVDIIRAGIWKPRTRPNSFEGVGAQGLPWLQKVKESTGLPVTVEVAKASHVDLCLQHGIDILWIGARTTVNPFAVQEIAEALKGVKIPVMVKNPINPDIALWIGGVERLQHVGITQIAAIHRGFSFAGEKIYRNRPLWQLAIDFKQKLPHIPMICDPSHITGRRDLLKKVSQKAMDLNYDGLMIESHITPDEAWSDAAQQITPEAFATLINGLILRDYDPQNIPQRTLLEKLRREINLIDDEIINLLSSRMAVAREIGNYKKAHNITILQSTRWQEILNKYVEHGTEQGLSEEFLIHFIRAIHDESIDQQESIFTEE